MSEYVYAYIHPEHGWVYVGRTSDLAKRIQQHDNSTQDNIGAEHSALLHDSSVHYIEVANKAESICIEAYLINKNAPMLNKALVYNDKSSSIQMQMPSWQRMEDVVRFPKQYINRMPEQWRTPAKQPEVDTSNTHDEKRLGKPRLEIDETAFKRECKRWIDGDQTATAAMKKLGLKPNTFYRRAEEMGFRKPNGLQDGIILDSGTSCSLPWRCLTVSDRSEALNFTWEQMPLGARIVIDVCLTYVTSHKLGIRDLNAIPASLLIHACDIKKRSSESYSELLISQLSSASERFYFRIQHEDGASEAFVYKWFECVQVNEEEEMVYVQFGELIIRDHIEPRSPELIKLHGPLRP